MGAACGSGGCVWVRCWLEYGRCAWVWKLRFGQEAAGLSGWKWIGVGAGSRSASTGMCVKWNRTGHAGPQAHEHAFGHFQVFLELVRQRCSTTRASEAISMSSSFCRCCYCPACPMMSASRCRWWWWWWWWR